MFNQSEYFRQKDGSEFKFKETKYHYRNDLPPENDFNKESINNLINVEVDLTETRKISPLLNNEILYLKNIILITLCKDPFSNTEVSDIRAKYFSYAEEGLKNIIKGIELEEEAIKFKFKINVMVNYSTRDQSIPRYIEYLKRKYRKLIGHISTEGEDPELVPKSRFDYADEDKPHSIRRSERLSWIIR